MAQARKAAGKELVKRSANGGNKSGAKMLISDSESVERSSRSDNKGSYHKWSKSSVAKSSPGAKKRDHKGSPELLLVPSRDSSKHDTIGASKQKTTEKPMTDQGGMKFYRNEARKREFNRTRKFEDSRVSQEVMMALTDDEVIQEADSHHGPQVAIDSLSISQRSFEEGAV